MSAGLACSTPRIAAPDTEALHHSLAVLRLAVRADAAFLWTSDAEAAVPLHASDAPTLGASEMRDLALAANGVVGHDDGTHAWLAVRLAASDRGALCVAAAAPRTFDDADAATIQAVATLVSALQELRRQPPPQAPVDVSGTRDAVIPRREPNAARILLADDLDLNRRLIADMLSLGGHRVDCVSDGAAAVRAVTADHYDLVLMDMIMPGMDGLAATRAIRELPRPARDVPIVALTANSTPDQLGSCLEAGMDAALTKPMSLDALSEAVAHWTRGRHAA